MKFNYIIGVIFMTLQIGAFAESVEPDGDLTRIAAVQDDTVFTSGDDMRVPSPLPFLVAEAALIEVAGGGAAQIQSPSLRQVSNIDLLPIGLGLTFISPEEISVHPQNPIPMRGDEAVNFLVNGTTTTAVLNYGLVWFSDGPIQRVTGPIYPVRAESSATGVANAWVNTSINFAQDLPVGSYDVVGMQASGVGLVAARLNFVGGAWRPGVPGGVTIADNVGHQFRHGKMGVFGTFHTNTPPTVDFLAAAATVPMIMVLDLIFRG